MEPEANRIRSQHVSLHLCFAGGKAVGVIYAVISTTAPHIFDISVLSFGIKKKWPEGRNGHLTASFFLPFFALGCHTEETKYSTLKAHTDSNLFSFFCRCLKSLCQRWRTSASPLCSLLLTDARWRWTLQGFGGCKEKTPQWFFKEISFKI